MRFDVYFICVLSQWDLCLNWLRNTIYKAHNSLSLVDKQTTSDHVYRSFFSFQTKTTNNWNNKQKMLSHKMLYMLRGHVYIFRSVCFKASRHIERLACGCFKSVYLCALSQASLQQSLWLIHIHYSIHINAIQLDFRLEMLMLVLLRLHYQRSIEPAYLNLSKVIRSKKYVEISWNFNISFFVSSDFGPKMTEWTMFTAGFVHDVILTISLYFIKILLLTTTTTTSHSVGVVRSKNAFQLALLYEYFLG